MQKRFYIGTLATIKSSSSSLGITTTMFSPCQLSFWRGWLCLFHSIRHKQKLNQSLEGISTLHRSRPCSLAATFFPGKKLGCVSKINFKNIFILDPWFCSYPLPHDTVTFPSIQLCKTCLPGASVHM